MKETWAHFCVSQNEDVMKSMLGERIDFLEKLVAKKDAEIETLEFLISKRDVAYKALRAHLETCQDRYDQDIDELERINRSLRSSQTCDMCNYMERDECLRQKDGMDVEIERSKELFYALTNIVEMEDGEDVRNSVEKVLALVAKQQADLALWDGREQVLCDLIDEKEAEIERLKEGFKRNRYSFIRENEELRDEIAKLTKDAGQWNGV